MDLGSLRRKVRCHLDQHMYESAVFLADKLVTMSGGHEDDVYTLAQAYFRAGLHHRAIYTVVEAGLVERHSKFRFLVAKCHVVKENWEEALAVLGDGASAAEEPPPADAAEDYRAAMSLLRGNIYDAMDDRDQAVLAYRTALRHDCCCYEAFKHLTEHHLLTSADEQALISEIAFGGDDAWLELLYRAKVNRYDAARAAGPPPPSPSDAGTGSAMVTDDAAQPRSSIAHLDTLESSYNLSGNLDLLAHRAEVQYYSHDFRAALATCREILQRDPHHLSCLPVYLCTLHELGEKNDLFYQAHQLVDEHPQAAVSWFAVGCYYHLTGNYDSSRRYFEKATHLDNWFAPAWLGYGNAFAAQVNPVSTVCASWNSAAERRWPVCRTSLTKRWLPIGLPQNCSAAVTCVHSSSAWSALVPTTCRWLSDTLSKPRMSAPTTRSSTTRWACCITETRTMAVRESISSACWTSAAIADASKPGRPRCQTSVTPAGSWVRTALIHAAQARPLTASWHMCGRALRRGDWVLQQGANGGAKERGDLCVARLHAPSEGRLASHRHWWVSACCFRRDSVSRPPSLPQTALVLTGYYHQALGLKSEDTFATEMLRNAFEEIAQEPFQV